MSLAALKRAGSNPEGLKIEQDKVESELARLSSAAKQSSPTPTTSTTASRFVRPHAAPGRQRHHHGVDTRAFGAASQEQEP